MFVTLAQLLSILSPKSDLYLVAPRYSYFSMASMLPPVAGPSESEAHVIVKTIISPCQPLGNSIFSIEACRLPTSVPS